MGFGTPIDDPNLQPMAAQGTAVFAEAVRLVADALDVDLDEVVCEAEYAKTTEDVARPHHHGHTADSRDPGRGRRTAGDRDLQRFAADPAARGRAAGLRARPRPASWALTAGRARDNARRTAAPPWRLRGVRR